jgi:hypothetical protein
MFLTVLLVSTFSLVRQAIDISSYQVTLVITQKFVMRWHDIVLAIDNYIPDATGRAAMQPDVIGQVWCAQHLVTFGISSVTRRTHNLELLLTRIC